MKKITKIISIILLVIMMTMNIPNVSFGATRTVTNETELQSALEDASVDTIVLANDIHVSTALQLPYEGRNIEIQGNPSTIYGDGVQYLFVCSSDISTGVVAINFTDVTIDGNSKSSFLYMVSGTLSINGLVCNFASNTNSGYGGAVYVEEGNVEFSNSTFNNCSAATEGGAIYNQGILGLSNCNFTNNSAPVGGAIYNNIQARLGVQDCTFNDNTTTTAGGAICNAAIRETIEIRGTDFNHNTATSGGAIYTNGPIITTKNHYKNNTSEIGGGIHGVDTTISIEDSFFENNTATQGGGISTSNCTVTIIDTIFSANQSSYQGGAIFNDKGEYTIQSFNEFTDNSATQGGGIYTDGRTRITGKVDFIENYANEGGGIYTVDLNDLFIDSEVQTANFTLNEGGFQTSIIYFPEYITIHEQQIIGNYTTSVTPYLYNNYDINFALSPNKYLVTYGANTTDPVENMPEDEAYVEGEMAIVSNQIPSRVGYTFRGWNDSTTGSIRQPGDTFFMPAFNVELLAIWEQNLYTLKFDSNTSETVTNMPNDINYSYQEKITIPDNIPERSGYTFTSWNTNSDGTGEVFFPNNILIGTNSNQVLYAQWEAKQANTVYEANTIDPVENLPPTETHRIWEVATISNLIPVRTGYIFIEWNTNPEGTGTFYQPGEDYIVSENGLTLYAMWEPNQYRLSYEPNTTSPVYNMPQDQYYLFGDTATVSSQIPQRIGHIFSGWNTNPEGTGTAYQPNETFVMPNTDVILYAQWTPISYTLTFNPNTSDPVTDLPDDIQYEFAEQITIPDQIPQREEYTFNNWNTRADGLGTRYNPGDTLIGLDSDEVLYAQWTQNPVNIIYDANTTESVQNLPPTETHIVGELATISEQIPMRVKYSFEGWNTTPDGTGIPYQPNQQYIVPENGLTLYAQWKAKEKVLHFEPNATDPVENLPADIVYIPGDTITIPSEIPTRNYYVFTGWNTEPNGSGMQYQPEESLTGPERGLTIYAQWTIRQDVVSFNPNTTDPVENLPEDFNYVAGETISIPSQMPTRENYMFINWSTQPDGSGAKYQPGETLIGPEGGLPLYASWEPNQNPPVVIIVIIIILGIGIIILAIILCCEQRCSNKRDKEKNN